MLFARGFILHNKKKLFTAHTFLLALCARPYPLPLGSFATWPPARVGHVDNVDHQFEVTWPRSPKPCALPGVDNVDNCFLLVHMIHKAFCFAPVRIEAWTFVDKVDHLDHRFKLAPDEVSTMRYTML